MYVEPVYSGEIAAAKAGIGNGAITVSGVAAALTGKDILISPDVTLLAAGSAGFSKEAAAGNAVFTIGEGLIYGFAAVGAAAFAVHARKRRNG